MCKALKNGNPAWKTSQAGGGGLIIR